MQTDAGTLNRRVWLGLFLFSLASAMRAQLPPEPATVRISVLSLFHPATLAFSAERPLTLLVDGRHLVIDSGRIVVLRAANAGLTVDGIAAHSFSSTAGDFTLSVPGKLTRQYRGALTVTLRNHTLVPVITMETETAVASIIAAESPPGAPLEALKAQAVVSRSYLLATLHAHLSADACDTTHCQFLRSPPAQGSLAAQATAETAREVLGWTPAPGAPLAIVAAQFSPTCGGHTLVPAHTAAGRYPFYSVRCEFCLRHPERYTAGGHHVGLCQLGAAALARQGATSAEILRTYFPNTAVAELR